MTIGFSIGGQSPKTALVSKVYADFNIMDKICLVKGNDLCNNSKALEFIMVVAKKYDVPYWILIGIMYHESKFGTAYHPSNREDCRKNTNNWA